MELPGETPLLGSLRAPLLAAQQPLLDALVYARFAVLAALAVALLRAERGGRPLSAPG